MNTLMKATFPFIAQNLSTLLSPSSLTKENPV